MRPDSNPANGTMRPRLRSGVFFTATADGAGAVVTDGAEVLTLPGAATYGWLERLAPYLDGRYTVAELTARLPESRRRTVEGLVGRLYEARMVRDTAGDRPHGLTADELTTYAAEIALVEAFRDSPASTFERYRNARTAILGAGQCLVALVHAVMLSGIREVRVGITGECPTDAAELARLRDDAASRDSRQRLGWQRVDWHPAADGAGAAPPAQVQALVVDADLVLHISDKPAPDRALALERLAADKTVVQVLTVSEAAWVGPVGRWSSFWHRLQHSGAAIGPAADDVLTGPVPGIVANHAAFACFEYLTRLAGEDEPHRVVRVDLETLETRVHRAVPHPSATPAVPDDEATFLRRVTALAAGPGLGDAEVGTRLAAVTDELLGVLVCPGESYGTQLPLRVARAVAVHPAGPDAGPLVAVAAAGEAGPAAARAGLRAAALHAWHALDVRRLVTRDSGTGEVHGLSLVDSGVRLVPAARAFAGNDRDPVPTGVVGATSWSAALDTALLAHCADLLRERGHLSAWKPVDLDGAGLDDDVARLRDLLDAARAQVTTYDLGDVLGLPGYAVQDHTGDVTYHVHLDRDAALRAALTRALLAYQTTAGGSGSHDQVLAGYDEPVGLPRGPLVDAIVAAGYEPVAVPLDHDPALSAALPYLVHVVLLPVAAGRPG